MMCYDVLYLCVLVLTLHAVDKSNEMLGSYSPVEKPYEVVMPRNGWEEAPSGMLARGSYTAVTKFVDDDKQTHLEFEYAFAIRKGWDKD